MHLDPITPVDTQPHAGELPVPPGACGSAARLAVLLYLAKRPLGASREVLCEVTGLDEHDMGNVLRGLYVVALVHKGVDGGHSYPYCVHPDIVGGDVVLFHGGDTVKGTALLQEGRLWVNDVVC